MGADTMEFVLALVIAVVLHELAHGVVARALGDRTAERAGRLTLNPLKHIDPLGSIVVPLILGLSQLATIGRIAFLYGWAKPVPVQPLDLRWHGAAHPRQLMAVVALAGPLANFALALLGGLGLNSGTAPQFWVDFILVNLMLGIFNLIPLPPMDGGRIAVGVLPLPLARVVARAEKFGILAVLLLLFVLPTLAGQFGLGFDPFGAFMGQIMPRAVQAVLWLTGHNRGN